MHPHPTSDVFEKRIAGLEGGIAALATASGAAAITYAIQPNTKAIFIESLGNPNSSLIDVENTLQVIDFLKKPPKSRTSQPAVPVGQPLP